jgi:hypothetical protein
MSVTVQFVFVRKGGFRALGGLWLGNLASLSELDTS